MKNPNLSIDNIIKKLQNLKETPLVSLEEFFKTWGILSDEASETFAYAYISYTCDTSDSKKADLLQEITLKQEEISQCNHEITKKILNESKEIPQHLNYAFKKLDNAMKLFTEKNLPLDTQDQNLSQEYQNLTGQLTIQYENQEIPLSMTKTYLQSTDRGIRETVFKKVRQSYYKIKDDIDNLFEKQVHIRHQCATNLNFENYRDFAHQGKDRFDYSPKDCLDFDNSILEVMVPLSSWLLEERKKSLGLEEIALYDLSVDFKQKEALKPSHTPEDFMQKALDVLEKVDPAVKNTLYNLQKNDNLDLFARKNKAPGGYNFPLSFSKSSFIFMNSAFTHSDMLTLFHEAGHAFHFDCYKNNDDIFLYKSPPSEVAELASMSMELLSMKHWDILYPNQEDLKRAQFQQLEGIIHFFPWMAVVDSFQQWIYLNPKSSIQERNEMFKDIYIKYHPSISLKGYEKDIFTLWQKQLHIIEVPFYYIEYGIAQLGALQVWKNSTQNPQQTFQLYQEALSSGSRYSIKETYQKAGIELDFSKNNLTSMAQFLKQELLKLL